MCKASLPSSHNRRWPAICLSLALLLGPLSILAQEADDDTAVVDTETTADPVLERDKLKVTGDVRFLLDYFDIDFRDGNGLGDSDFAGRVRLRSQFGLTHDLRLGARLAGLGLASGFDPEFIFQPDAPGGGLESGQFTFDELYALWTRGDHLSIAAGRIQTRFVLRGGVFARSLDRNDSNNVRVTWTDGVQATYRADNGWTGNFILQYNGKNGPGSVRRSPLDFSDPASRVSWFAALQSLEQKGPIVQRTLSVSYLPQSLRVDGLSSERREDYWVFTGRLALRWPQKATGTRVRGGVELGYAPTTPSSVGANLDRSADGLAWNVVVSLMDFAPNHNIAVNYGQTGAGWLLSPHFAPNEESTELRYQWRVRPAVLIEARLRVREDLVRESDAVRRSRVVDAFVRLTSSFDVFQRR